jgi:hypothetical protein
VHRLHRNGSPVLPDAQAGCFASASTALVRALSKESTAVVNASRTALASSIAIGPI